MKPDHVRVRQLISAQNAIQAVMDDCKGANKHLQESIQELKRQIRKTPATKTDDVCNIRAGDRLFGIFSQDKIRTALVRIPKWWVYVSYPMEDCRIVFSRMGKRPRMAEQKVKVLPSWFHHMLEGRVANPDYLLTKFSEISTPEFKAQNLRIWQVGGFRHGREFARKFLLESGQGRTTHRMLFSGSRKAAFQRLLDLRTWQMIQEGLELALDEEIRQIISLNVWENN